MAVLLATATRHLATLTADFIIGQPPLLAEFGAFALLAGICRAMRTGTNCTVMQMAQAARKALTAVLRQAGT